MPITGFRNSFDTQAPSFGARVWEEFRDYGLHSGLLSCYYILASKMGKDEFSFPLWSYPFRVRGNPRKLGVDGLLYSHRERFESSMKEYFRLRQSGGTFLDIGANYGYWSRFVLTDSAARDIHDVSVVAFEPLPDNYQLLVDNMRHLDSGGDHVRCEPFAVSDASGSMYLNRSNGDPGSTFVSESGDVECRITTIDEYVAGHQVENVALMKVDVEGFELRVLRGARQTIKRDRPMIICEVIASHLERAGTTPQEVFSEMVQLGYSYEPVSDADYLFRPLEHCGDQRVTEN